MTEQIAVFFFFNDTATTEIYTLSLHDALPILWRRISATMADALEQLPDRRDTWLDEACAGDARLREEVAPLLARSEEHTSELQSRPYIVCRLLLEKKKDRTTHEAPGTPRAQEQ